MNKTFGIVILIVAISIGFLIGYSIPPFIHAGVFSERKEKGVAIEIDEKLEKYYKSLHQEEEEE